MHKKLTCIECPVGCDLTVDHEGCTVITVSGNQCPKGYEYARAEVGEPKRILTASVLCENLDLKMLPVRTDGPIPKAKLLEAMERIRQITVDRPVKAGERIETDFLGLGVNLVATRNAEHALRAGPCCQKGRNQSTREAYGYQYPDR